MMGTVGPQTPDKGPKAPLNPMTREILKRYSPFMRAWAGSERYPGISLPSGEARGGVLPIGTQCLRLCC